MFASFCFFGDNSKTVLQTQSQKTSEFDNDEWGTDVSGPSEWQLPPGHVGSGTQGVGHRPALEAHRPGPKASPGLGGCAAPTGQATPDQVGQFGAFNNLGSEVVLLNEELGRALVSQ